jgi:hypothetical protein
MDLVDLSALLRALGSRERRCGLLALQRRGIGVIVVVAVGVVVNFHGRGG